MTDTDTIEQRLRRALRAVADEPVLELAVGQRIGKPDRPRRRRTTMLAGAAVAVVVLGTIAVVYGPRSSKEGPTGDAVAIFVPASRTASLRQLSDDAVELSQRLNALGDTGASAVSRNGSIVIVGGTRLPVPASTLLAPGSLQFRPVLCASAPYTPASLQPTSLTLPTKCSAAKYSMQGPNLVVNTTTGASNLGSIAIDPVLAAYPTSTPTYDELHPDSPVLLPVSNGGGERHLLGSAQMNGQEIADAHAEYESGQWLVDVTLTSQGSADWDRLTQKYFHEFIAIDQDGQTIATPLIQPTQTRFTSFDGHLRLSAHFTSEAARVLAAELVSGPLATPLVQGRS
jgi:hypothetical protein